jgi:diguanylate cyclase (GGDEF)-like protein
VGWPLNCSTLAPERPADEVDVVDLHRRRRRLMRLIDALQHGRQQAPRADEQARRLADQRDVVGLKGNDSKGHAVGDELLKRVVTLIASQLRSYDLIIRLGGDEFLCAMTDMTLSEARRRFDQVGAVLAASCERGAIRDDESATQLIGAPTTSLWTAAASSSDSVGWIVS